MTELALLLLLPCRHTGTPLLQSGTTEWFHMKKQHLKPMVKVSSHLCLSDIVRSNLLGLGWEAWRGWEDKTELGLLQFSDTVKAFGFPT